MPRLTFSRGCSLLLASMLWLVATVAHAREPGRVTVKLSAGKGGTTPAYVCVVTKGQGSAQIPMTHVAEGLLGLEGKVGWIPSDELPDVVKELIQHIPDRKHAGVKSTTPNGHEAATKAVILALLHMLPRNHLPNWLEEPSSQGLQDLALESIGAFKPTRNAPVCSDPSGSRDTAYCAASVKIRNDRWHEHHVACTGNPRATGESKVLWLEVVGRDGGATVGIDQLRLAEDELVLDTNLKGDGAEKHLVVLGGHYVDGTAVVARDEDVSLTLEPLCDWSRVELPRVSLVGVENAAASRSAFVPTFELAGAGSKGGVELARECVAGDMVDNSVRLLLPRIEGGARLHALVKQELPQGYAWLENSPAAKAAQAAGSSTANHLEFEATWADRSAPPKITMGVTVLTFFWEREKCFYPRKCPTASIHGLEKACDNASRAVEQSEAAIDNGCYYRCALESDPAIGLEAADRTLDVPVTFTSTDVDVEPRPGWSATIDRVNAVVQEKMGSEDRYLEVSFRRWSESTKHDPARFRRTAEVVSDEIEGVIITDAQGRHYHIDLALAHEIEENGVHYAQIPHVSCNEGLELQVVGQRKYKPLPVVVREGSIEVPHPMEAARGLYVGLGADVVAVRPVRPAKLFQDAPFRPGLVVSFTPRVKPRTMGALTAARSWRFDVFRLDLMLSDRPFEAISSEADRFSYDSRRYFVRGMLGFVARSPELELGKHVHLAIAPGLFLGTGRPLFQSDRRYVGGFDMNLTPMMEAPIRLGRIFELRPSFRAICLEDFHRYSTDLHGRATDRTRVGAQCTMAVGGGIAITL